MSEVLTLVLTAKFDESLNQQLTTITDEQQGKVDLLEEGVKAQKTEIVKTDMDLQHLKRKHEATAKEMWLMYIGMIRQAAHLFEKMLKNSGVSWADTAGIIIDLASAAVTLYTGMAAAVAAENPILGVAKALIIMMNVGFMINSRVQMLFAKNELVKQTQQADFASLINGDTPF